MEQTAETLAADLIAKWEGFRARPYLDAVQVPTIGYGTTRYPNGFKVRMTDAAITEAQGRAYLIHDMAGAMQAVSDLVKVPLTARQSAALTSFIYNLGRGAFAGSTLLRKLNAGDYDGATAEFGRWNRAGGKVLAGLTRRRADEAALFRG